MATELVLVSTKSTEMIFSGNMYKAPPLDRKRRKKWHERHFVLRANRTLECYKSMKAAESHKTPRRIIDLRECISLEIGLEYGKYEHILSLGTFQRTFFFAAPSDALMLQWANVLEKTKNAQDEESIEILDIGLRKTHVVPVVQRVKPPSPAHRDRLSVDSPKRNNVHHAVVTKGVMSLGHFSRESAETINLRGSYVQGGKWEEDGANYHNAAQRAASFNTSYEAPHSTESSPAKQQSMSQGNSPQHVQLKLKAQLSNDSYDSESSRSTSTASQPESVYSERPTSESSQQSFVISPSHVPSPSHLVSPALLSSRVPPPSNIIGAASRTKDGFFVAQKKPSEGGEVAVNEVSSTEKTSPKLNAARQREFVVKDGALQRFKPLRNGVKNPKISPSPQHNKLQRYPPPTSNGIHGNKALANGALNANFESNMKRSFRYKMITLRPEKPIFVDNGGDNSDSEDEEEHPPAVGRKKRNYKPPVSQVPGPHPYKTNLDSVPERQEIPKQEIQDKKEKQKTEVNPETPANTKPYQRIKPEPKVTSDVGQRRANSYSKLTVMGVKSQPDTTATIALPDHIAAKLKKNKPQRKRSNSQSDVSKSKELPMTYLPVTSLSQDDILMENDNAAAALTGIPLEEADVFDILPARPPSNGFMYASMTSLNSLDNILVEPPPMFSEGSVTGDGTKLESPQIELESHQPHNESEVSSGRSSSKQGSATGTRKPVPTPRTKNREAIHRDRAVRQFHVGHMTIEPSHVTSTTINTNSKSLQLNDPSLVDRSSTESNDTGYTSGANPGCAPEDKDSSNTCVQEFKLKFKDDCEDTPSLPTSSGSLSSVREKGKHLGIGVYDKQLSSQLSRSSITSSASDYARFYIPLIFYKPESKTDRAGLLNSFRSSPTTSASNVFSLQVCLVEDSEELLKDLMSLKSQEGYTVVECDEIEGSSNVSTMGDDFTVETALEDLEFGFTVIKSTQQDLFVRKVRQFHFEIQKLFGSSKPFSCEVVVRHADQITILPIEVDMKK